MVQGGGVGFTLINAQQQPCATATVKGATEKHSWHVGGRSLFIPLTLSFFLDFQTAWGGKCPRTAEKKMLRDTPPDKLCKI